MIRVFYDGKCGLCSREISCYRHVAPQNIFEWIDITVQSKSLLKLGTRLEDGLKSLNVQNSDGKIHQGIGGFLLIWEQIPVFCWLSRTVRIRPFYLIAIFLYARFAAWHFTRMGCQKCDI